jgi:xylulose-5-phosphate/fructose-6-phosphate phosphoketolase
VYYEGEKSVTISTESQELHIPQDKIERLNTHWRAANYLGVAQLYLKENALLREPLMPEHIKPRLLGHWGTVPGLNFIYTHLNRLIIDKDAGVLLIVGPGHGAPAILANLYLEGSLGEFYTEMSMDAAGLDRMVRAFSWPGGLPSHVTPLTPGTINEGGELGYSLVHAYGAAFDNPELIVACIVADGEAETGPLAASWHSNKFLNPATDGAVLPILHLNEYKLSGPTILGRMSDQELDLMFRGHGYVPRFVEYVEQGEGRRMKDEGTEADSSSVLRLSSVHTDMWKALDWAYVEIRAIQKQARAGKMPERPAWPLIVLRTPKGWTCPKLIDGIPVEGSFHSHQIPVANPAGNPASLALLESWMKSYGPKELFDEEGKPVEAVRAVCPAGDRRMGKIPASNGGLKLVPLKLPDYTDYAVGVESPGASKVEGTRVLGRFLRDVFVENDAARNFRFFCPDETHSNRLEAMFEATARTFVWPLEPNDEWMSRSGRIMEVLSEHLCQGWLEGYLLTGRHGMYACYEGFITIVDSMVNQYAKWLKIASEVSWRAPIASLNYLLTSHAWRQDHNGYSHQGPGFINTLLTKKSSVVRIYLPPDANCLLSVADHCLASMNYVNLIVADKQPMPQWLDMKAAQEHCARGASIWEWAGNDEGQPDVVLASAGDAPTQETIAAAWLLRKYAPDLRVRVVNVVDLFTLESFKDHPHGLDGDGFRQLFTDDTPVIFAFHGYPRVIHELIYHRPNPERFHVRGYIEEGTTTTPFDMVVLNRISRYHLAIEALRRVPRLRSRAGGIIDGFNERLAAHSAYIKEHGADMPEITEWTWSS